VRPGNLYVGTSGFAYPGWAPRFYPPGTRGDALLREYASRLPAVELNNTFYRQPRPEPVSAWLGATPPSFRFAVKAQRGGSMRAFGPRARDPEALAESIGWLTGPYRLFGQRLGSVLYRIPANVRRDDDRLRALLGAWPDDLPLSLEFQDRSWVDDEVHSLLRDHRAALCATDLDDGPVPDLRLTGAFVYLRLRRQSYDATDLDRWSERLAPFLADGRDAYVFFRHDESGQSALDAEALAARVERLRGR
jgi:uncharacterized protein YecE (DUF72 family)